MLIVMLISAFLVALNTTIHYLAMRGAAAFVNPSLHPGRCLALAVSALTLAHLIEALFYAGGFWLVVHGLGIGNLTAAPPDAGGDLAFMDYYYFSLVNYTTLGRGDLIPSGHLRFIASIEAFHGFLLITASGSYLLQIMGGRNPFA